MTREACRWQTTLLEEARGQIVLHALTCEFQRRTEGWRVGKNFSARFPSEGRSERDALVGMLVGRNGCCRKKLRAARCSDGGFGFCEAL